MYAAAVKRSSLVWLGPSGQADVTQHFLGLVGSPTFLDGDIYAGMDEPANIKNVRAEYAKKRGCFSKADSVPFMALFSPNCQERINAAINKVEKQEGKKIFGQGVPADKACIVDASQSESRARAGTLLLPATKSAALISVTKEHIFTPNELDFAMGWPTLNVGKMSEYANLMPEVLKDLSSASRKRLAGNGMCLQQVVAFLSYCFAHTVRRSSALQWTPPLHTKKFQEMRLKRKHSDNDDGRSDEIETAQSQSQDGA